MSSAGFALNEDESNDIIGAFNEAIAKEKKYHKIQIKNAKEIAKMNAVKFVKKASDDVANALTKEFQTVLKQFVDFKNNTWYTIDHIKDCEGRMRNAEMAVGQAYPIYEYRYKLDTDYENACRKFDCLKPLLEEHMVFTPVEMH